MAVCASVLGEARPLWTVIPEGEAGPDRYTSHRMATMGRGVDRIYQQRNRRSERRQADEQKCRATGMAAFDELCVVLVNASEVRSFTNVERTPRRVLGKSSWKCVVH